MNQKHNYLVLRDRAFRSRIRIGNGQCHVCKQPMHVVNNCWHFCSEACLVKHYRKLAGKPIHRG